MDLRLPEGPQRGQRVLYVVPSWFTLEFHLRGQLSSLRKNGFEVEVASEPRAKSAAEREGVRLHQLSFDKIGEPLALAKISRALAKIVREGGYSIINVSTKIGGLLIGLIGRRHRVTGVVYLVRGINHICDNDALRRIAARAVERINCRLASDVIFLSQSNKDLYTKLGLCPLAKADLIAAGSINGVDLVRFRRSTELISKAQLLLTELGVPDGAVVLGFVGRLAREKGINELEIVWQQLRARHENAYLMLLTPEEIDPAVENAVTNLRADPRVRFVGFQHDPVPAYVAMDCLLMTTTIAEGFSNVAIEAAALEIPVIATRIPGYVDAVVDGETGLLVSPSDIPEMVEAADRLLLNKDQRLRFGSQARQRCSAQFAQEIVWHGIAEKYAQIIQRASLTKAIPHE